MSTDNPDEFLATHGNVVTMSPQRGKRIGPLFIRSVADAQAAPHRQYLLKGIISAGEMSVTWGEPGCGKSFLAMHVGYALAQGRPIFGRRVRQCRVLYLGLEGEAGVEKRIQALSIEHGEAEAFAYIAQALNLFSDASIIEALKGAILAHRAKLVIVDTLNRAMADGSENDPSDMGALIANLDRLRQETGVHIAIIHHGPKDGERGPRGHSALIGAVDMAMQITNVDGTRTAKVAKAKDDPGGSTFGFRLRPLVLGTDEDGDEITTCVVDEQGELGQPAKKRPKLTDPQKSLIGEIHNLFACGLGERVSVSTDLFPVPAIGRKALQESLLESGFLRLSEKPSGEKRLPDSEHSRLWKLLDALKVKGLIGVSRDFVWLVP